MEDKSLNEYYENNKEKLFEVLEYGNKIPSAFALILICKANNISLEELKKEVIK